MNLVGILGLLGVAIGLILATLFTVLKGLLSKEVEASLPAISESLLARAADRLPAEHRERFLEEWQAELGPSIKERPLWALAQAASLYRAAPKIAAELEPAPVPVRGRNSPAGFISQPANRLIGRVLPGLTALRSLLTSANDRLDKILDRYLLGSNPREPSMVRIILAGLIVFLGAIVAGLSILQILETRFGF